MTPVVAAVGSAMLIAVSACGQAPQGQSAESLGAVKLSAAETLQQSAKSAESVNSYSAQLVVDFTAPKEGAGSAGGSGTVKGSVVYHQKPQIASDVKLDQISVAGQNVPGGVRLILLGDTAYVKMDMLTKLMGGTKPWIKVDLAKAGQQGGVDVDQLLRQAQQVDLQTSVKMLTTSKDVTTAGTESVGGVETTHYKGTFVVADAVKQLAPELRQNLEGQLSNVKDMKFDAWIDAQNLPRKVEMNGAQNEGSFKLTSTFGDFNSAAEVTAPPAAEVGELPSNLGNIPAGGGDTTGGGS
ncbi:LppX_LprAFG lipoprotein [Sphaerisporangium krabiense]|uniref:Outer membrane lipoprotein-sorting protein n=1 Tax=Sphaerisporangium krabiense TaxID=763782 RepID=A0A7W8Z008_9ACTN|nr:LppX_LprAFG lipoprotein [Sphaerisporangium krabiense]MBB5624949.1 outer membrane lipoprotein-sorting protein [Sphaerisporangium krabiense]